MSFFDKMATFLWNAPGNSGNNRTRAYEAVNPTHKRPMRKSVGDGNVVTELAGMSLRQQTRYAYENYDLAKSVLDTLVARIIGRGLIVEPQILATNGDLHEEANEAADTVLKNFAKRPEVTGMYSLSQAERLMCMTWLRDGEGLCNHVMGAHDDLPGSEDLPYRFQLLEPDHLPVELDMLGSPRIIQSVEVNRWFAPVAYHILEEHPEGVQGVITWDFNTQRIPADRFTLLALRQRINQLRGVSVLAPVLTRLIDTQDYDESERIAHKLAAKLVAYIEKGNPDSYDDSGDDPDDDDDRLFDLVSGTVMDDLRVGESMKMLDTRRHAENIEYFRNAMMRAIAGGTNTNFSSISRNYSTGSYSAQRQELVEGSEAYAILRDEFVSGWRRTVHERMILAAVAAGAIPLEGVDLRTVADAQFYATSVPWIDIKNEADAQTTLVSGTLASRSEFMRQRGKNPREVARQMRADEKLFAVAIQAQNPEKPEEPEEPEAKDEPAADEDTTNEASEG